MNQKSIDVKTTELLGVLSRGSGLSDPVREWYRLFPHSFYRIARQDSGFGGNMLILRLLAEDVECCGYLCDTTLLDASSAVTLAHRLAAVAPDLDLRLARAAVEWIAASPGTLRRCLFILHSMKPGARINSSLVQLLGSNDGAVKSKVFELLIRTSFNEQNIRTWLRDPDPRVRANLLEVLSKSRPCPEWICQVLFDHLSDSNPRTAANAAVALFRMRDKAPALAQLTAMASSDDPARRCSAAWALGQIPDADVVETLKALRADVDDRVRWNALKSLSRVHKNGPGITEVPPTPAEIAPDEARSEEVNLPADPPPATFHAPTFGLI